MSDEQRAPGTLERLIHWLEEWSPLTGALLTALAFRIFASKWLPPSSDAFSNVTNVGGIAVGFLGTTQAFLFSMPATESFRILKQLGKLPVLIHYFNRAIIACLAMTLVTLWMSMRVSEDKGKLVAEFGPNLMMAWVSLSVWALLTTLRVVYFSNRILRIVFSEKS